MARRKKSQYLEDQAFFSSDSDSGGGEEGGPELDQISDPDLREAILASNPDLKRRKRSGRGQAKSSQIYGVFGQSSDEEGRVARGRKDHHGKVPSFVPSTGLGSGKRVGGRGGGGSEVGGEDTSSHDSEGSDDDSEGEEEEEGKDERYDQAPRMGGLGFKSGMRDDDHQRTRASGFVPQMFVSSRGKRDEAIPMEEEVEEEEEDPRQDLRPGIGIGIGSRGGIGSSKRAAGLGSAPSFVPPSASRAEQGQAPLTGSAQATSNPPPSSLQEAGMPTSFGGRDRVKSSQVFQKVNKSEEQRRKPSFLPSSSSSSPSFSNRPMTSIKFGGASGGGFDPSKFLQKMGWTGGGLGKSGEGIINPIEVQVRPERAGLAYGGLKEKTKQAKEEARRRGEAVSSSEEDERGGRRSRRKKKKDQQASASKDERQPLNPDLVQAWTKAERKPRKPRVQHRTYEQIIEQAGGSAATEVGLGQIIDATGKEMREVSSIASALAQHSVPTSDSTRLPELRHNLRLICDTNKQTLDALAREGAGIVERTKWLKREAEESRRRRDKERVDLARLKEVISIVTQLETLGRNAALSTSTSESNKVQEGELEVFDPLVKILVRDFQVEIERENLDEAVVGSMGPTFKRLLSEWSPLEQPQALTASLKRWRAILKVSERADGKEEDLWPTTKGGVKQGKKTTNVMTPFESLLWNSWMPKMRSCINNDWKVEEASSAVELVESWRGIIPRFIMDNILDQLILPKLKAAISDWDPRRSKASLHRIVFPWISVFGDERFNETLSEAKRRLKASLKTIKLDQVVAARLDLEEWKGVYRSEEWDNLMLETVVPRLGSKLRNEFKVDPSDQDMTIMTNVVSWWSSKLIRPSILSRLLEREFFPKWLNVLHQWLIQPRANLDEVAQWYTYWKSWFPSEMVEMEGIQHGFNKAIRLMDRALELGERRETQLEKPDTNPLPRRTAHPPGVGPSRRGDGSGGSKSSSKVSSKRDSRDQAEEDNEDDSSFRRIVEEEASRHDLIVISLNRSEPSSAKTLLTISDNVGGKRGIQFYIQDDVCWVQDSKPSNSNGSAPFSPLGVSDLIQRVKRMR